MEIEITIRQILTDGKTCNLYDISAYEGNAGFATAIGENTQGTEIFNVEIPNGGTDVIVLPDEEYVVNVNGIEVDSGSFPVYGNVTIDINL